MQTQAALLPGIRKSSKSRTFLKKIFWPLIKLRADLLVDGYIERSIGKWIKELLGKETIFLEIGCGDMSLLKFLPDSVCYNAFDLSLSEFQLRRVFAKKRNINLALASATSIPLKSGSVSLIVATEVFEHIPKIDKAIREIHRIAKPKAKLICTIPNNYSKQYKKYPHPDHINSWTFEGFKKYMHSRGFRFLKGHMKGFWLPIFKRPIQLPISKKEESDNNTFFYMFEVEK